MTQMSFPRDTLITGMGAALIDLAAHISDSALDALGSRKGHMALIDASQSQQLQARLAATTQTSQQPGGAAANSIAGLAGLGIKTGFIGKIGDDAFGQFFAHALATDGTRFVCRPDSHHPTGHCVIVITPDGERTMHTHLGASVHLQIQDLPTPLLATTHLLFGEGYLWDSPTARAAFLDAAARVRKQGNRVALSLGDADLCVRHRADLRQHIGDGVDIIFANQHEAAALFETQTIETSIAALQRHAAISVLTMSGDGAWVIDKDTATHIPPHNVPQVMDSTGAGDQFAAGFMAGLVQNRPLAEAGQMGALLAAQIIQQVGARPLAHMRALLAQHGFYR